jgi:hypothetical protein
VVEDRTGEDGHDGFLRAFVQCTVRCTAHCRRTMYDPSRGRLDEGHMEEPQMQRGASAAEQGACAAGRGRPRRARRDRVADDAQARGELGAGAMSLYHYVPNKSELLDGMVDIVFSEIELPSTTSTGRPPCASGRSRRGRCSTGTAGPSA